MEKAMRVSFLGCGAWGLALANHLYAKGYDVILWEHQEDRSQRLQTQREDPERLPGIKIEPGVRITSQLEDLFPTDYLVFAVPSHTVREVARKVAPFEPRKVISVVKGLEIQSLKRMSEVITEELGPQIQFAVLSGPTIAIEVARGLPTTAVVASEDINFRYETQILFHSERFRVYTSADVIGVELGGSLKNVIAIAAGAVDGLGLGANTKGALITRGLAEMMRLGVKLGASPVTFSGLSGLGDLVTTCFSKNSRNRYVGEQIGKGRTLDEILSEMVMIAEGVKTSEAAYRLSTREGVEMPITSMVRLVLRGEIDPKEAVKELLSRTPKDEHYGIT